MNILVTGATGLLGSEIICNLEKSGHKVLKACFSERGDGFIAADITKDEGIARISSLNWDYVIHTSAWRNPDLCENRRDETYRLNTWATEKIAKLAAEKSAGMTFISTDYVFSGKNPPYNEESRPCPINYYGETKMLAEKAVRSASDKFLILRIPVIYGIKAGLKASDLLNNAVTSLSGNQKKIMDDTIVRYPTYTGDVADAIEFLIARNKRGIYHISGMSKTTKYGVCCSIADVLGKNMENISRGDVPPNDDATRPKDSHIEMDKILALGFRTSLPFDERIKILFKELGMI